MKCNFCSAPAKYDARILLHGWAYVCQEHFTKFECKLGTGQGQELKK